jgi:DivIVA domain-containing protein
VVSFFLVFLAVVLIGAVLWASVGGRADASGSRRLPALLDAGFEQPPANLPPVLLPANAAPRDVDRVRFSLGLRGYRMDQVDQVLDELRDQLAASRHEVETLKAQVLALESPGSVDADTPGDSAPAAAREPGNSERGTAEPSLKEPGTGEDRA